MSQTVTPFPLRFMRRRDVEQRTGLARATIYMFMEQGNFPKPIKLGNSACVAWLEHEIEAWMREQIDKTRGNTARA